MNRLPNVVQRQSRVSVAALQIREEYKDYFCKEGMVAWQNDAISKHNM